MGRIKKEPKEENSEAWVKPGEDQIQIQMQQVSIDLMKIIEVNDVKLEEASILEQGHGQRKRKYEDTVRSDTEDQEGVNDVVICDNQAILEQDNEELESQQGLITIAKRHFVSELPLLKDIGKRDIELTSAEIVVEFKSDNNNATIHVSNVGKKNKRTKLSRTEILSFGLDHLDSETIKTIGFEFEFFKPLRVFEKSDYVIMKGPSITLSPEGIINFQYEIMIKECCIYSFPIRLNTMINNVVSRVMEWVPTQYETPYSLKEITRHRYAEINSKNFYNMISDIPKDLTNTKLEIDELKTSLFEFQQKTVNWLLQKENCVYDVDTKCVKRLPIYDSSNTEDDAIGKALDLLCFGWSRVQILGKTVWYNKYMANLTSSKFAAYFMSTVKTPPGAQGLLAEEMGLGKTVEIISLVLLNKRPFSELNTKVFDTISARHVFRSKTTLIICPSSILKQWYQEISNLAPALKISIYKGVYAYNTNSSNNNGSKSHLAIAKELSSFDIVLATYQTVSREIHHALYNPANRPKRRCARTSRNKIANAMIADGDIMNPATLTMNAEEDDEVYEEMNDHSSPLVLLQFWRVILDEVQMVSSKISNAARIAKIIPRYHSWGVSGTPIRKDLNDLHAFLAFSHLYPFNDNLASPKLNRLFWSKLVTTSSNETTEDKNVIIPFDFIRLFKNIALRHTKRMVSDEIKLPPQRRVLFQTQFTPVERDLYDRMFEQFLNQVQLNDKGEPLIDSWEPNSEVMAVMREWLIKLRQACCHSQIGTSTRRSFWASSGGIDGNGANGAGTDEVRTVKAVLTLAIEDNEKSVLQFERNWINLQIEKGQIYEFKKLPELSLKTWEPCMEATLQRIQTLRDSLAELEQNEDNKDLINNNSNNERLTAQRNRLRSWLEILHKLYFFIASAHYQIYTPQSQQATAPIEIDIENLEAQTQRQDEIPDEELSEEALGHRRLENEFYDKAELLRRELLQDSISKVNKLVKQLHTREEKDIGLPLINADGFEVIGMEASLFLQKYKTCAEQLNKQASLMNKWLGELSFLLDHLLKDNAQEKKAEAKIDENEYDESLVIQDKAYAYLDVLQKCFKERHESLLGSTDNSMSAIMRLDQDAEDDEDQDDLITIFRTGVVKSDFHKKLDKERKEVIPNATFQLHLTLKSLVANAKEINDSMAPMVHGAPQSLERQLFTMLMKHLKESFDSQRKNLTKVRKTVFEHLNDLYNARIEYYKSLQILSDSVKGVELESLQDVNVDVRMSSIDFKIMQADKQRKTFMVRTTYLKSLEKTMDNTNTSASGNANGSTIPAEEERICIICQSGIESGVLTACGHQYCDECLKEWMLHGRNKCPMCKSVLDADSLYRFKYTKADIQAGLVRSESNEEDEEEDIGKAPSAKTTSGAKENSLMHTIYHSMDLDTLKKVQTEDISVSYGSKIDLITKVILHLKNTEDHVQIVIFSQWSELLYLIEFSLKAHGIRYLNSNGVFTTSRRGRGVRGTSATATARNTINDVDIFKKNPNITCFLLNAKAQASGLTLVNASHVFLCEPLVNTALELQAISRIHRIGQRKPTTVWMFAITNTVEESIVKLGTKKRLEYLGHGHGHGNGHRSNQGQSQSQGQDPSQDDEMNEAELDEVNTEDLTKTVEGLVDKKSVTGGEVVPNDDLWSSFFS